LIYTLRCIDSNEATQTLYRLRRGDYDGLLLVKHPAFGRNEPKSEIFPWEDPAYEDEGLLDPDHGTISSIPTFHDWRSDRAMGSQPQPTFVDPDTVCPNDRCKLASAYTTAGSGFPPRLSLDKILSKPEEEHNFVSHKRSSADRSMTST
jgi:hypothetical protein